MYGVEKLIFMVIAPSSIMDLMFTCVTTALLHLYVRSHFMPTPNSPVRSDRLPPRCVIDHLGRLEGLGVCVCLGIVCSVVCWQTSVCVCVCVCVWLHDMFVFCVFPML